MGYFNTQDYNFGSSTPDENASALNFLNDYQKKKKEEEDAIAAEQARIDVEKNRSTASKVWGFTKNTAQEIGSTVAGSARAIWNDPKKTLPMAGNTIMNEIDKSATAVVDLTFNKIPNFLMGMGWNKVDPNDPFAVAGKEFTDTSKQQQTNQAADIQSKITSPDQRKLVEGATVVGQTLPYFLLPTTPIGAGIGVGAEATTGSILKGIGVRALARGTENAAGSVVLDTAMGKQKEEVLKNAMTNFVAGTAMSATLEGAIKGISAAKGYKYNQIARQTIDEYGNHLISGTKDPVIATELLDNGTKSPKISSSLEESLAHIGEDVTNKETLMATPEGQNALAGTVVHSKMSADAKKAVYKEIVDSGLFKIEKGDSVDEVIQKGISSVLANGENVRPQLNLTGKYADSVLGVINPELNKIADAAIVTPGVAPEATNINVTPPEAPITPVEPLPIQPTEIKPKTEGEKFVQFPEKTVSKNNEPIDFTGINPENIVHFNQGDQFGRVTMIVSAEDKRLIEAGRAFDVNGNIEKNTAITNKVKALAAEQGITEQELRKLAVETNDKYKALAKTNRDANADVLLNTVTKTADRTPVAPEIPVKTAQTPPEAVSTPKGSEVPPTTQNEPTFPEKTGVARKISDKLMDSEKASQVYTELEVAQAGFRKTVDGKQVSGKSTFPDWVPNEYTKDNGVVVSLRDRKLFDQVQDHFINGTVPTDELQLALYDVVHNELRKRMDLPAVEFPTEGKIVKAQRLAPEKPVRVATDEKAVSQFSKRYNEMYHPEKTPTSHDIAHNDAQIKKALEITRIDYDRAIRIATGVERSDEVLANATAMAVLDKSRFEATNATTAIARQEAISTEKLVIDRMIARSTRFGEETQILSRLKSFDPAYDAVKTIKNTQNKAFEVKTGEKVGIATDKTIKEIDSHIKPVTSEKFAKFINDHPC